MFENILMLFTAFRCFNVFNDDFRINSSGIIIFLKRNYSDYDDCECIYNLSPDLAGGKMREPMCY